MSIESPPRQSAGGVDHPGSTEAHPLQPIRLLGDWIGRHAIDIAVVVGLGLITAIVHAVGMAEFPARFDDEGAYMSQAWSVVERFDLSHYTYWYDHPPLGWLLLAGYSVMTGAFLRAPFGVAAGREAMLFLNIASTALVYALARRLGMRRGFAALATVLFGLSPLGVFFHRMVLLDNVAMPLLLAGFVLILSPNRHLGAYVGAAVSLGAAVLIRETFVLFVPFAVWLYWRRTATETRGYSVALTATAFFGLLLLYPMFALLRGELVPSSGRVSLLGSIQWQLFGREGSGSLFDASSPAREVVAGWLALDPVILLVGVVAGLALLRVARLRWIGGIVLMLVLMLMRPGYLPVMFVVGAIPFLSLGIAGLADEIWRARPGSRRARVAQFEVWARRAASVALVAMIALAAWPVYSTGTARAMTLDADRPFREAQAWLETNLETDDRILVDGALWLDVVRSGHPAENAIWFYKLDTDPGVRVPEPGDWRAIDYVVVSEVVRNTTYELPQAEAAVDNGHVVATFGSGESRIEILEVAGG